MPHYIRFITSKGIDSTDANDVIFKGLQKIFENIEGVFLCEKIGEATLQDWWNFFKAKNDILRCNVDLAICEIKANESCKIKIIDWLKSKGVLNLKGVNELPITYLCQIPYDFDQFMVETTREKLNLVIMRQLRQLMQQDDCFCQFVSIGVSISETRSLSQKILFTLTDFLDV